jgi:PAS domain S-box-containing protein
MILSFVPIWIVDVCGSLAMIVFGFFCMRLAHELRSRDRSNVIWTYLLWFSIGLSAFAISRSGGHLLKQLLLMSGQNKTWSMIQPFSGAINTLTFVFVGSVTLFFERVWNIYRLISRDKKELQETRDELLFVNQNLEELVGERTTELAQSEEKFRRIFEVSKDMIVVLDPGGRIMDINPHGLKLLNNEGDPPLGKPFERFVAGGTDWPRVKQLIATEGSISNIEITLERTDGATVRTLVSGSFDRGTAYSSGAYHLLIRDIEQRRLMEEQIAQADKLASIGQLSAGVAHEINNPLGIILGYTQLMLREEEAGSERYGDLKIIEKHSKNCRSIVSDLLDFSRSSKPSPEMTNMPRVIDDVLTFIDQHSGFNDIHIVRDYDNMLPDLLLDEKRIKQVFINLLMNAAHAVGEKGLISIRTVFDRDESRVRIEVSDSGHGIAADSLPRIFEPFFTTKPTGEGTGLGLSVSYGIVKTHGGDILVESVPGQGSTFTVILPLDQEALRKNR